MRVRCCLLAAAAAVLLSGCGMRTVDQMYRVPRRSESYSHVESAMDMAMAGLTFAAPVSGENQQNVQLADINGDGVDEYILYARGNSEKPLNMLIFTMDDEETCYLMEVIELNGSAFQKVEYVDIDDQPGKEIVVGRSVSDQIMGAVSVYSLGSGEAVRIMNTSYSAFLTCDLDQNGSSEVVVIQPGEDASAKAVATRYSFENGAMVRSSEQETSTYPMDIKRLSAGVLQDGNPAVYLSSAPDSYTVATDVFALRKGRFQNITAARGNGNMVSTLQNYYIYPTDIDDDGILEMPSLIDMKSVTDQPSGYSQYLIRWYSVDAQGREWTKRYTFHDYAGGWNVQLDSSWANRISVEQEGNTNTFYLWDREGAVTLFRIYALSGPARNEESVQDGRFPLYRKEGVTFAAKLAPAAEDYGITQEYLINSFRPIYQDWNTGET